MFAFSTHNNSLADEGVGLGVGLPGLEQARNQLVADETSFGADAPPTLISRHNYAEALLAAGHLQEAEAAFRRALAGKEKALGATDVTVGVTLNSLGSLLAKKGELAEAETVLRRALAIRGALPRHKHDAAITCDELGCVLQAAGRAAEARALRLQRGREGLICSNPPCSKPEARAGQALQNCTRCWAVWYCGKACQKAHWKEHKKLCSEQPQPGAAAAAAAAPQ